MSIPLIRVGHGTCGVASGAAKTYEAIKKKAEEMNIPIKLQKVGCMGMCFNEPVVNVKINGETIYYKKITEDKVPELLAHLTTNTLFKEQVYAREFHKKEEDIHKEIPVLEQTDFFGNQKRLVMDLCGKIEPLDLKEYESRGGFSGLHKALAMKPQEVVNELEKSKLRGRGGAGFPTYKKWQMMLDSKAEKKVLVCNADEGDPGAFMNRNLMEGNPFRIFEGMLIAAYALGASKGYIYTRVEYPLAIKTLKEAIRILEKNHYLGKNILNKFDFEVEIRVGAGAYVCGEETALLESLEGKRGQPRLKPPFPVQRGAFGLPTNINNVGTYSHVTKILQLGGEYYSSLGTEKSGGTKIVCLTGNVPQTGVVEVPMGTIIKDIIVKIGHAPINGVKAIQTGGPSGGCIPFKELNIPLDYEPLLEKGSIMGSGGIVVMNYDNNMVDVSKYFLSFSAMESCGKCIPCREGTTQLIKLLEKILAGKGSKKDILVMENLSFVMKDTSLCGLGMAAPNPLLSALKYYRHEFEELILPKEEQMVFIDKDRCIGCNACSKVCPANAIKGKLGEKHEINQELCTKCKTCVSVCPVHTIHVKKKE